MSKGYSENSLIEQPAIELLAGLGWQTIGAFDEVFGAGGTLGRENSGEVVLTRHLIPALKKLNPQAPPEAIDAAVNELTRDRSVMSLAGANREVYGLLKNGVKVDIRTPEGGLTPERIRVIDWDQPTNNHFLLVSQLWVQGEVYKRRPDLVGFVNGLPLLVAEFKAVTERLESAFQDNIRDYRTTIPHLFAYNGFIVVSNGTKSRMGSVTAEWEHYCDWKKISSESERGCVSLETILKGTCDRTRLLDLVENFTLFEEKAGKLRKIVAKNHQYLGVNSAIEVLLRVKEIGVCATLTPALSQGEREIQYRGGFRFAGLVKRARELRKTQTSAEELLWSMLRNRRFLDLKFRRQHQFGPYLADFYCHEAKLIVETDGEIHETSAQQKKDHKRDAYLKSLGLQVLRFPNALVLDHPEVVLDSIAQTVGSDPNGA